MNRHIALWTLILGFFWGCHKESITISSDADDLIMVDYAGAQMPVRIRGNTASNVMIVFVHGGPGGNALLNADASFMMDLQARYGIAYWDQRNSGSAQGQGSDHLTIAQFAEDLKAVIQVLKARYGEQTSIFLYAHSWGGTVTSAFLTQNTANQDLVKGWICVDGAYSPKEIADLSRRRMIAYGQSQIDQGIKPDQWQDIVDVCTQTLPIDRASILQLNAKAYEAEDLIDSIERPAVTSGQSTLNPSSYLAGATNQNAIMASGLIDELFATSFMDRLHLIQTPTLAIWGKYDFAVPTTLADTLISYIGSTSKQKLILDHSGHVGMSNEPNVFNAGVIGFVEQFR